MGERLAIQWRPMWLVCPLCAWECRHDYYAGVLQDFACAQCGAEWGMVLDEWGKVIAYEQEL